MYKPKECLAMAARWLYNVPLQTILCINDHIRILLSIYIALYYKEQSLETCHLGIEIIKCRERDDQCPCLMSFYITIFLVKLLCLLHENKTMFSFELIFSKVQHFPDHKIKGLFIKHMIHRMQQRLNLITNLKYGIMTSFCKDQVDTKF